MEYLTAPWREAYVRGLCRRARGCVLCSASRAADERKALVLHRGAHHVVLLNKFPYTPGHLMIAPLRHRARFEKEDKKVSAELAEMLKLCLRVLRRGYRPQGFNVGMNLGKAAGAGVTGHYHLHVICRWEGDSNFMPLAGGTRVFIETLQTAYNRLRPLFRTLARPERA
jgi:ATP adenylyltransferase